MTAFDPGSRLVVPLDVANAAAAEALATALTGHCDWLKIGLELFMAEGPQVVRDFVRRGFRIMLDVKLHDIPHTVERASERAVALGVELLTVHAGGGQAMLEAAARACRGSGTRVLAVTALTSLDEDDLRAVGIAGSPAALALRRARLALASGCDGVVCSPHEAAAVRAATTSELVILTPGVRPAGLAADDQKRVMTPRQARAAGADLVVVGRPIWRAADPAAAARAIAAELA